ncbi:hypothetical protein ALC53_05552 [Atta colombica]|uniref:Uncharacterized protein n=1 Tax=Atta colombica TaxID=520822 RepID=A0A195BIQ9_9HYME|nr:hypothetical protein ALC53_05552 [Atta colombica]
MELLIIFYSLSVNLAYLHTTDLLVSNENIGKRLLFQNCSISRNLLYVLMNILESDFPDEFCVEIIAALTNVSTNEMRGIGVKLEIVAATFAHAIKRLG